MGQLIDGIWRDDNFQMHSSDGAFKRKSASFRNWITPDGRAGVTGESGFKAEAGRYHLYVSLACPWAHRTLIMRELKGLGDLISVDIVHPDMGEDGWEFAQSLPRTTGDSLFHSAYLRDIYTRAKPDYTGRVTVPVLWDKETDAIVNNESSEIIRIFNRAFDGLTGNTDDYWPKALRPEIETINDRIYETFNNGVYRAGFARTQEAYDAAAAALFETLDWLEDHLAQNRYLMGATVTEADWRLFPTLIRFDPVYHTHFKCNRKWIREYPDLWAYTRELYQWPGIAETVDLDHIQRHYYTSHESINPSRIIPINPVIDYDEPHGRMRSYG